MPLLFRCSACHGKLRLRDELAGRKVKCPKCGSAITAPADISEDEPVEAAAPAAPPPKSASVKAKVREEPPAAPEEHHPPRVDDDRPRRKKRKKRQAESSNAWMLWAAGVGVLTVLVIVAMLVIANSSDEAKEKVKVYIVSLAIMVPISTVFLVISMFVTSAMGGGTDFGAAHVAIVKAICLLLVVNFVQLLPLGWFSSLVVYPVWLLGLTVLFHLDWWEKFFISFVNWFLNTIATYLMITAVVLYILHGKADFGEEDLLMGTTQREVTPEERAKDFVDKLEGDYEEAKERGSPVVRVDLSGKRFADKDVDKLAPFTKLRDLDLSNTQITDAGLKKLHAFKFLNQLQLTGTKVTDAGVQELQKALPQVNVTR